MEKENEIKKQDSVLFKLDLLQNYSLEGRMF